MSTNQLNFLCRVCLSPDMKTSTSIWEKYSNYVLIDFINSLASVEIKVNDGLPSVICMACFKELKTAVTFKLKCENSNIILQHKVETFCVNFTNDAFIKKEDSENETSNFDNHSELTHNHDEITINTILNDTSSKKEYSNTLPQCHDCGDIFKSKCKLRVHWKKVHLPKSLICEKCKRAFKSYNAFNKHKTKMGNTCKVASSEYVTIEGEGKSRVFHCKECNYKSSRIKDVSTHLVIHSGERPFQCAMCSASYTQLSSLEAHKETAHNAYKVEMTCHFCGKYIKGRRKVYRHLKTHTENEVQCNICKKMLKNKKCLATHMKRHGGIKNYTCEVCAVTFYTCAELCNHRRIVHHKGKHWYKCAICEYKSMRSESVKKHQIRHTNTNIPCTVCGMFFESKEKMLVHNKLHFEEKIFPCPHCDAKFLRRNSVSQHVRKKHLCRMLFNQRSYVIKKLPIVNDLEILEDKKCSPENT